jgi:hypothetical protein
MRRRRHINHLDVAFLSPKKWTNKHNWTNPMTRQYLMSLLSALSICTLGGCDAYYMTQQTVQLHVRGRHEQAIESAKVSAVLDDNRDATRSLQNVFDDLESQPSNIGLSDSAGFARVPVNTSIIRPGLDVVALFSPSLRPLGDRISGKALCVRVSTANHHEIVVCPNVADGASYSGEFFVLTIQMIGKPASTRSRSGESAKARTGEDKGTGFGLGDSNCVPLSFPRKPA